MTEPNKELPKEVVEKLESSLDRLTWFGEPKSVYHEQMQKTKGAKIAQSHYAPIIEAKDKEIAELKDAIRVSKLNSEALQESCDDFEKTLFNLKSENKKIMGLLKESRFELYRAERAMPWMYTNLFEAYCKGNGIELGGE